MGCGCSCLDRRRRQSIGSIPDELPADRELHPVVPPTQRKAAVYRQEIFDAIDKRAVKTSKRFLKKSFPKLVKHLTKTAESDIQKVRALFKWATSVDIPKLVSQESGEAPENSPLEYLQKIHWKMGNHAHLFAKLCKCANIPCSIITGINKNASYRPGCRLTERSLRGQWNAVHVDGCWRLLDVLWASSCLKGATHPEWVLANMDNIESSSPSSSNSEDEDEEEIHHVTNEFFFLTDPDMLVGTHFPDDPKWQLLPRVVSQQKFATYVYVRERFFDLGLRMSNKSQTHCVLKTKEGSSSFEFHLSQDPLDFVFKFLFYHLRGDDNDDSRYSLDEYVIYEKTNDILKYSIRFPRAGCFRMDVFGQDMSQHRHQDLVCSYVIECREPKPNCDPLPDLPENGWGITPDTRSLGVLPVTHSRAVIISDDGRCEIRLQVEHPMDITYELKAHDQDDFLLKQYAVMWWEKNICVMQTRFSEPGEYAIKFNGSKKGERHIINVCNYLVQVINPSLSQISFPVMRGVIGKSKLGAHYNIQPLSHNTGVVRVKEKLLRIEMKAKDGVELLAEVTNNEISTAFLNDRCTRLEEAESTVFEVDLPRGGEYAMNIFAKEKGAPENIHHVYTYLVQFEPEEEDTTEQSEFEPPPFIIPTSISTAKKKLPASFSKRSEDVVGYFVHRQDTGNKPKDRLKKLADSVKNKRKVREAKKDDTIQLNMDEDGDYELLLFEEEAGFVQGFGCVEIRKDKNITEEIGEIHIDITNDEKKKLKSEKNKGAQRNVLRRQLRVAMKTKNLKLLNQTIGRIEELGLTELKEELDRATEARAMLQIVDNLSNAMSQRDTSHLQKALDVATTSPYSQEIQGQIIAAQRVLEYLKRLDRLRRLDTMRQDILNLDSMTVAEIKSYAHPPVPVQLVMMATCILLGENENDMQDWRRVQQIINSSGRDGLQRRVFEYNVEKLDIHVAYRSKMVLSKLELDDVIVVSAGAATFYVWANGVIEDAEDRFVQKGGDMANIAADSANNKAIRKVSKIFESYFANTRIFHGVTGQVSKDVAHHWRRRASDLTSSLPVSSEGTRRRSKVEKMEVMFEKCTPRSTPPSTHTE